jgi:Family of unknown function (DUF6252)
MKSIKLLAGLFLIFAAFTFTSCENEPIDSAIDLDTFNPGGGNNGNASAFTAKIGTDVFNAQQIIAELSGSAFGPELNIIGINNGKSVSLQLINPAVATFTASTTFENLLLFQYTEDLSGSGFFSSFNSTTSESSGTFTITEFNTTTKKISGTFSFTAYNSSDSSIQRTVTEGVINNVTFTIAQ